MTDPADRPQEIDEQLRNLHEQLQGCLGEWVAIVDSQIVGHSRRYADLLSRLDPTKLDQVYVMFNGAPIDLAPYVGQWVAMCDGAVVAHAETYEDIANQFPIAQDIENCTIFRVGPSLVPPLPTTDSER